MKAKTVGLYLSRAFAISWNAKKDKITKKITEAAVTHEVTSEELMASVTLNGHTLEDIGRDFLCRMVEKNLKLQKEGEGEDAELWVTRESSKKEVLKALKQMTLEVRTPEVETISVSEEWDAKEEQFKALGITKKTLGAALGLLNPSAIIVD